MLPLGKTANVVLLRSPCANTPNAGAPPAPRATGAAALTTVSGIPANARVVVGLVVKTLEPDTDARSIMAPTASLFSLATHQGPQCCSALNPICGPMKLLRMRNESKPATELVKLTGVGRPSAGW